MKGRACVRNSDLLWMKRSLCFQPGKRRPREMSLLHCFSLLLSGWCPSKGKPKKQLKAGYLASPGAWNSEGVGGGRVLHCGMKWRTPRTSCPLWSLNITLQDPSFSCLKLLVLLSSHDCIWAMRIFASGWCRGIMPFLPCLSPAISAPESLPPLTSPVSPTLFMLQ